MKTDKASGLVVVGDCLDALSGMYSVFEAAVLDPPAGVNFMSMAFDLDHGGEDKWIAYFAERFAAVREACIPGAWGLFWALPRTSDWTMQALRRAGWHVVDKVAHVYGQGWPKGRGQLKPAREDWILVRDTRAKVRPLNVDGCRVARGMGGNSATNPNVRKARGCKMLGGKGFWNEGSERPDMTLPEGGSWPPNLTFSHCSACQEVGARRVRGNAGSSGVIQRRKAFGIVSDDSWRPSATVGRRHEGATVEIPAFECLAVCSCGLASLAPAGGAPSPCACGGERWWACPVAMLDEQSGESGREDGIIKVGEGTKSGGGSWTVAGGMHRAGSKNTGVRGWGDSGGASRFFPTFHYDAKASRAERQAGCEHLLWVRDNAAPIGWRQVTREDFDAAPHEDRREGNVHATIKPIGCGTDDGFMRWAVRLVTPEQGPIVDGTCGSGSTLVAAQLEGRGFFGCDVDPGAVAIAQARVAFWTPERHQQALADAEALKIQMAREKGLREGPRHDDLPLFAGAR